MEDNKQLTVGDICQSKEFKKEIANELIRIDKTRNEVLIKASEKGFQNPHFKRGPWDALEEKKLLNAEALQVLYTLILAKNCPSLSASERYCVSDICKPAFERAAQKLYKAVNDEKNS